MSSVFGGAAPNSPADAFTVCPEYKEGKYGEWRLQRLPYTSGYVRGYFAGLQPFRDNFVLKRGDTVWMSLSPMERESQMLHVKAARGHVVIAGLGMGWLVANVARKPEVERVTVLELNPEVVELFGRILPAYEGQEKVTIRQGNALAAVPAFLSSPVDLLAADIWPKLGAERALGDVKKMQANLHANAVAWWGMELDFISWCAEQPQDHFARCEPTRADYQRWAREINLPLIEQDNLDYPGMAVFAAKQVLLY